MDEQRDKKGDDTVIDGRIRDDWPKVNQQVAGLVAAVDQLTARQEHDDLAFALLVAAMVGLAVAALLQQRQLAQLAQQVT